MKTLETTIAHSGYTLTQIWREGQVAVYSKQKANMMQPHSFEVVIVRQMKGGEIDEKTFGPYERYPTSEDWGKFGWTRITLESAMSKARQIGEFSLGVQIPATLTGQATGQDGRG